MTFDCIFFYSLLTLKEKMFKNRMDGRNLYINCNLIKITKNDIHQEKKFIDTLS